MFLQNDIQYHWGSNEGREHVNRNDAAASGHIAKQIA